MYHLIGKNSFAISYEVKIELIRNTLGENKSKFSGLPCDKVEFDDTIVCIPVLENNCPLSTLIYTYFCHRHLEMSEILQEWDDHELQCVSCNINNASIMLK